jgi:hypothetical protein
VIFNQLARRNIGVEVSKTGEQKFRNECSFAI